MAEPGETPGAAQQRLGTFSAPYAGSHLSNCIFMCFSQTFFEELLKEKTIVIPGIFFDINPAHRRNLFNSPCHQFVRISFGPPMEDLDRGALANRFVHSSNAFLIVVCRPGCDRTGIEEGQEGGVARYGSQVCAGLMGRPIY